MNYSSPDFWGFFSGGGALIHALTRVTPILKYKGFFFSENFDYPDNVHELIKLTNIWFNKKFWKTL